MVGQVFYRPQKVHVEHGMLGYGVRYNGERKIEEYFATRKYVECFHIFHNRFP